jgi:hypothetical protein
MNVQLIKIVSSVEVMKKLANLKFSAKVAFKMSKLLKFVQEQVSAFEDARKVLFEKYGKQVPDGVQILEEHREAFFKEQMELLEMMVTCSETFTIDDFENAELTPAEIIQIDWLIEPT